MFADDTLLIFLIPFFMERVCRLFNYISIYLKFLYLAGEPHQGLLASEQKS